MSKDSVMDSLGRIDDDMILAVETLRRKKKRPLWMKWGTLAACACLVIGAGTVLFNSGKGGSSDDYNVEMILGN